MKTKLTPDWDLPEQGTILLDTNFLIDFFNKEKLYMLIQDTIEEYGVDIDGVSPTDVVIGCFLRKYKGLFLLSRDHSDFPSRIFIRKNLYSVELDKEVKTYALYQYKPSEFNLEAEITSI